MGCNKICQAKKEADAAKKTAASSAASAQAQAAAAKKRADAAKATSSSSGKATITSYSSEVITVGKFLGIDGKQNALSINEMNNYLKLASRSPQVLANATAKNLITPISVAFGAYQVLDVGRKVFLIVKPAVKIAQQLNDVATLNFAAIAEMIQDIAQTILQLLIGFAPMLIELLKNIFLNIPLYTKTVTEEQSIAMEQLLSFAQINIKENISGILTGEESDLSLSSASEYNTSTLNCPNVVNALTVIQIVEDEINSILASYVAGQPFWTLELVLNEFTGEDYETVDGLKEIIVDYIIASLDCTRKKMLKGIISKIDSESIDILQIPDVSILENKDKLVIKEMMEGLLTVVKKIEIAEIEELLRRNLSASQLRPESEQEQYFDTKLAEAIADNVIKYLRELLKFAQLSGSAPTISLKQATNDALGKELKKAFSRIEETRQDIITVSVAEELVQSNKIQIFDNIINSLSGIQFKSSDVELETCAVDLVNTQFDDLNDSIEINTSATIAGTSVTSLSEMESLVNAIYNQIINAIADETFDPANDLTCGTDVSLCQALETFKKNLVNNISENLVNTGLNIATAEFPDYVDKFSLNKMLKVFSTEINNELSEVVKLIVMDTILPCKSCKPCEQLKLDIINYMNKIIDKIKNEKIRIANEVINDETLDWDSEEADWSDKKAELEALVTTTVDTNAGQVSILDEVVRRLRMEETELIQSIKDAIKST